MNREVLLAGIATFWLSNGGGEFSALNISFSTGNRAISEARRKKGTLREAEILQFSSYGEVGGQGSKKPSGHQSNTTGWPASS